MIFDEPHNEFFRREDREQESCRGAAVAEAKREMSRSPNGTARVPGTMCRSWAKHSVCFGHESSLRVHPYSVRKGNCILTSSSPPSSGRLLGLWRIILHKLCNCLVKILLTLF